ncbi:MAG: cobalamin-dependent protein [Anaerolineales bacterium]|nr:cobalamin-dependent protein [Anaerolineales bacterium]
MTPPAEASQLIRAQQPRLAQHIAERLCDHPTCTLEPDPQRCTAVVRDVNFHLTHLAHAYLDALLQRRRHAANQLIQEAVQQGTPVQEIYLQVFEPVQHEIGRLWQLNQISVAEEHYCTAATQLVMSQLYPHIFTTRKNGWRFTAASIGGELHELGIRMVADFFEMAGWDTVYLGANTPAQAIVETLQAARSHILGISATMMFHITAVAELIRQVRLTPAGRQIRIMVGGYPFNVTPDLWQSVGADGFASNAVEAVHVATQLLRNGHPHARQETAA